MLSQVLIRVQSFFLLKMALLFLIPVLLFHDSVLNLSVDDFANHRSVKSIKESALKLDFSFDLINVSRVVDIILLI